ncbi:SDR family oxidoreductase [Pseudomaricurvus alkylphenolicus]|uniref:SDR family oxidoreductase n=1 Tax=Pseudomaricurvus alkylphenolicus TaxID=1306991 RepID=UPI001422D411|nr:SDR family oxidoreductase [Pseudomaricurvus alkylphenolicus]NIB41464.1 SDR family oxidoreductase [Pseudomaricurvus alkylphenolicus]
MSKNAIVTGTSTGLGASIAVLLAEKGYKVYATMRDTSKKDGVCNLAHERNVTIHIKQLDVCDTESVERCVAEVIEADGGIDVLVNNAGAGFVRTTEQASEEEIRWVTDVNYMGVVRCTKAVLPAMRSAESGHIINISSVGGLVGMPFNEFYCAAKFAVEGYTESLASYITPAFGIRFTVVEPGGIHSEFVNSVLSKMQSTGGFREDAYLPLLQKYFASSNSRQSGESVTYQTADEVAKVACQCLDGSDPPVRVRTSAWAEQICQLKTEADPSGKKLQQQVVNRFLGN